MCFALQRHDFFSTFQPSKMVRSRLFWTGATRARTFYASQFLTMVGACGVLPCWLPDVLRATMECSLSASQRPKAFRHWVSLILWLPNVLRATTACNCNFSFLIWPDCSVSAALASLLSTLRSHKALEKHGVSRLPYLFAHLHLLFSDSVSSLTFFPLLFSSLTFFTPVASSVHIVGSLTSKLLSIMWQHVLCQTTTQQIVAQPDNSHNVFQERPDTRKATKWLAHVRLSQNTPRAMQYQQLFPPGFWSIVPATTNEPEASQAMRAPPRKMMTMYPIRNDTTASQNDTFEPSKTSSKFTKYCACHAKWPPKSPLISTRACQRSANTLCLCAMHVVHVCNCAFEHVLDMFFNLVHDSCKSQQTLRRSRFVSTCCQQQLWVGVKLKSLAVSRTKHAQSKWQALSWAAKTPFSCHPRKHGNDKNNGSKESWR